MEMEPMPRPTIYESIEAVKEAQKAFQEEFHSLLRKYGVFADVLGYAFAFGDNGLFVNAGCMGTDRMLDALGEQIATTINRYIQTPEDNPFDFPEQIG